MRERMHSEGTWDAAGMGALPTMTGQKKKIRYDDSRKKEERENEKDGVGGGRHRWCTTVCRSLIPGSQGASEGT